MSVSFLSNHIDPLIDMSHNPSASMREDVRREDTLWGFEVLTFVALLLKSYDTTVYEHTGSTYQSHTRKRINHSADTMTYNFTVQYIRSCPA